MEAYRMSTEAKQDQLPLQEVGELTREAAAFWF